MAIHNVTSASFSPAFNNALSVAAGTLLFLQTRTLQVGNELSAYASSLAAPDALVRASALAAGTTTFTNPVLDGELLQLRFTGSAIETRGADLEDLQSFDLTATAATIFEGGRELGSFRFSKFQSKYALKNDAESYTDNFTFTNMVLIADDYRLTTTGSWAISYKASETSETAKATLAVTQMTLTKGDLPVLGLKGKLQFAVDEFGEAALANPTGTISEVSLQLGDGVVAVSKLKLLATDLFAALDEGAEALLPLFYSGADTLTWAAEGNGNLQGYAGADKLFGGIGNDVLDGGVGGDQMTGKAGNDTYRVDDIKDKVVEAVASGTDTVHTVVSLALAANVENLIADIAGLSLKGNVLDNRLLGSAAGVDTLAGGLGNDTLMGAWQGQAGAPIALADGFADVFVFDAALTTVRQSNLDTVHFEDGVDKLQLSRKIFKMLPKVITEDVLVQAGAETALSRLSFNAETGRLAYDADGTGTKSAAVDVVTLVGIGGQPLSITLSDFLFV